MPSRAEWQNRPGRSKWIRKTTRVAIYLRDELRCAYCSRDLRGADLRDIVLDHLVPRKRGDSHAPHNLVTSCWGCNARRQARPWRAFASPAAATRIQQLRRRPLDRELARAIVAGDAPWPFAPRA